MTSCVTLYRMIELNTPMHWSRWGDPERAHPVSESMRELIGLFVGEVTERPAVAPEEVRLPEVGLSEEHLGALRGIVGGEHVRTDDEWRIARTRGKSTPDLLRIRDGEADDAPDAVVRPVSHDESVALTLGGGAVHVPVGRALLRQARGEVRQVLNAHRLVQLRDGKGGWFREALVEQERLENGIR